MAPPPGPYHAALPECKCDMLPAAWPAGARSAAAPQVRCCRHRPHCHPSAAAYFCAARTAARARPSLECLLCASRAVNAGRRRPTHRRPHGVCAPRALDVGCRPSVTEPRSADCQHIIRLAVQCCTGAAPTGSGGLCAGRPADLVESARSRPRAPMLINRAVLVSHLGWGVGWRCAHGLCGR